MVTVAPFREFLREQETDIARDAYGADRLAAPP
jgi:hypothetical protein